MDEEIQQPEPKISDVEIVLVGVFFGILDLIDLIPIAGDITDVIAAPMGFYYWGKGINATAFGAAEILDLIPGIQEIPSRTIGWGITVWLDRHPKILGKLEIAIEAANALEGNIGEAEEAAKENAARKAPDLSSNTLEMTPNANGAWEHNPQQSENAQSSEKTSQNTSEQEQKNERYRDLTEPEGAKDPIEEAKKKYFATPEPMPSQNVEGDEPAAQADDNTRPNETTQRLSKRFEDIRKAQQQTDNLREPKISEVEDSRQDDFEKAA